MKSDHRSKFSNFSNQKEEAWKISGLQRDSNPWPSDTGAMLDQLSCEACFSTKTKENVCIKIEFNFWRIYRGHKHDRRSIVWGHQMAAVTWRENNLRSCEFFGHTSIAVVTSRGSYPVFTTFEVKREMICSLFLNRSSTYCNKLDSRYSLFPFYLSA